MRVFFVLVFAFVFFYFAHVAEASDEYRVGMFGSDPVVAAEKAWQAHSLLEYTLAVEASPNAVPKDLIDAARELEAKWDQYFLSHALPMNATLDRAAVVAILTRHCGVRAGNSSCGI